MSGKTKFAIIFDDGFLASSLKTAEIFEQRRLPAVFAVLAHPAGFAPGHPIGDFALWRDLRSRGHHVHPHGYTHANLPTLPFDQATGELDRCLAAFAEHLPGFDARQAIFNYPYNADSPELNAWLLKRVRATRGNGDGFLDSAGLSSGRWHSRTFGPGDPTEDLLHHLDLCRSRRPPAFIYSLHGLDGECWGALPSDSLRRVLDTLLSDPDLEYWPV